MPPVRQNLKEIAVEDDAGGASLPFGGKLGVVPEDPNVRFYIKDFLLPRPTEFAGWKIESLAWKNGCSLHAGLSGPIEFKFWGPQAQEFLQGVVINGLSNFEVGQAKHAIALGEDGLVANHGVMLKDSDDQFRADFAGAWPMHLAAASDLEFEFAMNELFVFQMGGPTSLQIIERATGESLRHIAFLRSDSAEIAGVEVEILRVGMSGTLAYEVRGPVEHGLVVHAALEQAGEGLGLERMGWRTYGVNHVENGFPQVDHTFLSAGYDDPTFSKYVNGYHPALAGSVGPDDNRARKRSPVDLDWQRAARFDHDFVGREALEKEMAAPAKNKLVTLEWNVDDLLDIHRSLFEPGEEYKTLEFPNTPQPIGVFQTADWVLNSNGERVGTSTGITYSYYYRKMITHGNIAVDEANLGNELIIQFGDYGKRIKDVRATVARYPYLELEPNQSYDLSTVPSGV